MDFTEYDTTRLATLPGGGVEYHESVEEAVVREVLEETGHQVTLRDLLAAHSFTDAQGARRQRLASPCTLGLSKPRVGVGLRCSRHEADTRSGRCRSVIEEASYGGPRPE
ncbi:MAG: NUDIX domain-containing protein [Nocardioidaceae bacterium]